jgi:hypothetical protein
LGRCGGNAAVVTSKFRETSAYCGRRGNPERSPRTLDARERAETIMTALRALGGIGVRDSPGVKRAQSARCESITTQQNPPGPCKPHGGSSPLARISPQHDTACQRIIDLLSFSTGSSHSLIRPAPFVQGTRTPLFHSGNTGSNPVRSTQTLCLLIPVILTTTSSKPLLKRIRILMSYEL